MKSAIALCASLVLLNTSRACADVELTWGRATLRLSEKAMPVSLLFTDGTDGLNRAHREPFAEVQSPDGAWHPATAARKTGQTLVLGFEGVDTTLTLALDAQPDWLGMRIAALGGTRPRAARFIKLDTIFTETVGRRLNIGWNQAHALCVMATSPQTQARVEGQTRVTLEETVAAVNRGEAGVNPRVCLTAVASDTASAKLEGASAAILACATPDFKGLARRIAQAHALPLCADTTSGTLRNSYFRLRADTDARALDRIVALCKESGIRQVLVPWNGTRTVDFSNLTTRLQTAGLAVGARCTPTAPADERALAALADASGLDLICFEAPAADAVDAYAPFQERTLRLIRRPVACTGNLMTHRLWHAYGRCTTADSYLDALTGDRQTTEKTPTVREHVDADVAALSLLQSDMMAGELDLGIWAQRTGHGRTIEGLQLDDFEYLLSRSVGYDCPVSLEIAPADLDRNPLAHELARLLGLYEQARLSRRFTEAEKAAMRQPGQGFTLIQRRGFLPVIVPTRSVFCGNSTRAHATVGPFEGGSMATFWTASGCVDVTLDLSPFVARVADFDDQRVVAKKSADDRLVLPASTRRLTLFCPTVAPNVLEQKIKNSLCTDAGRSL